MDITNKDLEDIIKLSYVNNISLFNSATYGFFEENFNQHLMLNGENNAGKTTILNVLQFVLLPEVNLNNFKNKFFFSSNEKDKSYTASETYKYYFPANNSYLIAEFKNPHKQFCIIVHRTKVNNNNYEYERVLVELPFVEIKKHLVRKNLENETELINQKREDFLEELKREALRENKLYKTIKTKKDMKEWILSTRRNGRQNEFYAIPLKDSNEETLKSFSTLFKSLYNISTMTEEDKIKFISEIVEARNLQDSQNPNFDLKEKIETISELKKQRVNIETLINNQDNFENLENLIQDLSVEYKFLKSYVKSLWMSANKTKKDIGIELQNLRKIEEEQRKEEDSIEVKVNEKQNNLNNYSREKAVADNLLFTENQKISNLSKYISEEFNGDYESLYSFFKKSKELDSEKINIFIKNLKEKENYYIELIKNEEEELENIFKISKIKKEKETIQSDLINKNQELKDNQEEIGKLPFYEEGFNEKEKELINCLLSKELRSQSTEKITPEIKEKMKDFINLFEIEEDFISFGNNGKINKSRLKQENRKEILEKAISEIKEEISSLIKKRDLIEVSEENIEQKKFQANKNIENYKKLEKDLGEYIQNIKNIEYINKNILLEENKKSQILEKEEEGKEFLFKLKEARKIILKEKEELKLTSNEMFANMKRIEEILDKLDMQEYCESIFDSPVENINAAESIEVTDEIQEFEKYRIRLDNYKSKREDKNKIMSKFVNNKILENELSAEELNIYQDDDSEGIIVFSKMLSILENKYSILDEEKNLLKTNIEQVNMDIQTSISKFNELNKGIKRFEKDINEEFSGVQISNLKGVSFEINTNKRIENLLKKIDNNFDLSSLDKESDLLSLQDYILKVSKDSNKIVPKDLIESVEYYILEEVEGKLIKVKLGQSHGTETLINLIFLTILFKGIFKNGYKMQLLIPLDESGKIDSKNGKSLLDIMDKHNCKIISATPVATPDQLNLFNKSIVLDKKLLKSLTKKAEYIVEIDRNEYNVFFNGSSLVEN